MKDQLNINGHEISGRMPLFLPELRQAIRDDRKTMTRRVITELLKFGRITEFGESMTKGYSWQFRNKRMLWNDISHNRLIESCNYQPGDIRVMTEPLINVNGYARYQDDNEHVFHNQTNRPIVWRWQVNVLSSMFMHYEAARTLCRIIDVRYERLQDINVEDCIAEGVQVPVHEGHILINLCNSVTDYLPLGKKLGEYNEENIIRAHFAHLWDSINLKRGYSWESNPWVCVVTFERVE